MLKFWWPFTLYVTIFVSVFESAKSRMSRRSHDFVGSWPRGLLFFLMSQICFLVDRIFFLMAQFLVAIFSSGLILFLVGQEFFLWVEFVSRGSKYLLSFFCFVIFYKRSFFPFSITWITLLDHDQMKVLGVKVLPIIYLLKWEN